MKNKELLSKNETIRVRMAPSPTGSLHVGTARAALFNYLFAKHYDGTFILRIEDTDTERSDEKWEKDIIEGLSWLQIEWDEGPGKKGTYGPYRQSERIKEGIYTKYIEKMLEEGSAFYCWHTKEELQKERENQQEKKEAPRHLCGYRDLHTTDEEKIKQSIIRFKNETTGPVEFYDFVRGEVSFDGENLGDFSIAKSINEPLYNFAVVVDDYEMKVSHVIRGEDHISNTPRQIVLQKALKFDIPKFIHLPLILGTDKSKLSKRHGATSVGEYKDMGYLSEALFNFLSLLGWRPSEDEKELMPKDEIIKEFTVERIQQAGAVFDVEKLSWMNGQYIRNLSTEELATKCMPYFIDKNLIEIKNPKENISDAKFKIPGLGTERDFEWFKGVVAMEQERIKKLDEITGVTEFLLKDIDYEKSLLVWKDMSVEELKKILSDLNVILEEIPKENWNKENLREIIMPKAELTGSRGKMLWPLRVALSGKKASPGPFEIMEVIGKEESLNRVTQAHKKLV
ncbi:MAG: glutamate--tRNA ligase [Candidatus Spechtbacterales bacterium]|nr:glutamate--tRNA ligase [Candidatus Spechtbacterales bacterium]